MLETSNTVLLKDVRFNYLQVFAPVAIIAGAQEKYSLVALIPKEGKHAAENKAALDEVIERLKAEVMALPENKGRLPKWFSICLKDGDVDREDSEAFTGHYYIVAKSPTKPDVLSIEKDEAGKYKAITNADGIKSGDYGHVTVELFTYNTKNNAGIAAGLNNLMKTCEGASLAPVTPVAPLRPDGQEEFKGL